jgi:hypothetical protein
MTPSRRTVPVVALCLSFLALVALPARGTAQEGRAHSLEPGAWALQFSVLDNFRLGTFGGSMLSVKRHSSAANALRLGVSSSLFGQDQTDSDTTFSSLPDREVSFTNVGAQLQYVHYPRPGSDVNLYFAVGPEFDVRRQTVTDLQAGSERKSEERAWTVGLEGNLGVEWFPFRAVGVHAEYGAQLGFSSSTSRLEFSDPLPDDREIESDRWSFAGTGVAFGASVYF